MLSSQTIVSADFFPGYMSIEGQLSYETSLQGVYTEVFPDQWLGQNQAAIAP
jgi:hypothetical protein